MVAVSLPLLAAPAAAQSSARDEVLGAVGAFLSAMQAKDANAMLARLDTTARFTLLRPSAAGSRIMLVPGAEFVRMTTRPDGPTYLEATRNPVVQIDGDLATVWAEYQVILEGKVSHCGSDALHLARLGGRWKIVHLSDTFRREGCGERWSSP
jgi:hypothetical protein